MFFLERFLFLVCHPELLRWCWAAFIAVILAATLVQSWRIHFHQALAGAAASASADQTFIAVEPVWWFTLSNWVMLLAFPAAILLLAAYALARHQPRPLRRLYDRREAMMRRLVSEYEAALALRDSRADQARAESRS